ncbi:MAG: ABC transporter permease, partial [Bacilli bacterium]
MRITAIVKRIFRQFRRDKRTLALLIIAPLFVCTLLNYVFSIDVGTIQIGAANERIVAQFSEEPKDVRVEVLTESEANTRFAADDLDAYVAMDGQTMTITLNGSDMNRNSATAKAIDTL